MTHLFETLLYMYIHIVCIDIYIANGNTKELIFLGQSLVATLCNSFENIQVSILKVYIKRHFSALTVKII